MYQLFSPRLITKRFVNQGRLLDVGNDGLNYLILEDDLESHTTQVAGLK
jgi:hypothetical protein